MINSSKLLNDLKPILRKLEDDIRERSESVPEIREHLQTGYNAARAAKRTGEAFTTWRDEQVTQAAVAWILGCVFVRFIEDNELVQEPLISGPGDRLARARDQHTHYFRQQPHETDREYLLHVFNDVRKLPAVSELFDDRHNPIWQLHPSGDGAELLVQFFQKINAAEGGLVHDFADPKWNTRFLGDLYQDLSESARKKYALLQTPEFVEEFILDRTLTPAIETVGLKEVRMVDCTCGSGHFLLGGFRRILDRWFQLEPSTNVRELVQRTLKTLHGVDLNPFAVAIARFRLLVAALEACSVKRLKDAPNFHFNLAVGDSLLHGTRPGDRGARQAFLGGETMLNDPLKHVYETEDRDALRRILGQRYHAVVGNPPYITVKDRTLNEAYRERFASCHRKYSLAVPFMERFFDLAIEPDSEAGTPAGYVGQITTNAFMKREFGKKLIETYIPKWDLTHVIDTAGAYIPGHGTPTVILFGKHQRPVASTIRTVMGIKGEPSTPADPAQGHVWTAIVRQVDEPGSQSEFVSVADAPRQSFGRHPWSIGGGGAAELKLTLDESGEKTLDALVQEIGFGGVTREDEAFWIGEPAARRRGVLPEHLKYYVSGENVRDWRLQATVTAIWPYEEETLLVANSSSIERFLWPWRTQLAHRVAYGLTQIERGLRWFEYSMFFRDRYRVPLKIAYASVATHNHFIFARGRDVFKDTSFLIVPRNGLSVAMVTALLGILNSTTACFWMKQVAHCKGSTVDEHGARQRTLPFEDFYQFDGTKLKKFPVPGNIVEGHADLAEQPRIVHLTTAIDELAQELQNDMPESVLAQRKHAPADALARAGESFDGICRQMFALQEEIDWECYRLYGLQEEDLCFGAGDIPSIRLGERAFEIVMARQMAAGELETTWFVRHGSTPITELPAQWPSDYRRLVERRIEVIESNHDIALIERPEYKRRWNTEPWEQQLERALREWLLNRLENRRYWAQPELISAARLADLVRQDGEFMQVAEQYRGRPDFDVPALVTELVQNEGIPLLPVQRYKASGLRKREAWEHVWGLQRQEDAIDKEVGVDAASLSDAERHLRQEEAKRLKKERIGDIAVPPKYGSGDFKETTYWRLRGKLDVPKERFILFPGCEREADPTPVITWAGWDHVEQAKAIAGYYEQVRNEGWSDERRIPLLAGVLELVPWLKQWHNDIDPAFGIGMGDFFEEFVKTEARAMGKTLEDLRNVGREEGG